VIKRSGKALFEEKNIVSFLYGGKEKIKKVGKRSVFLVDE
jgi:hypothetical protein